MNVVLPPIRLRCLAGILLIPVLLCSLQASEPVGWQPRKAPLMTRWAEQVGPNNAWPEYPRPQLVRPDWVNLNGLWDYAITPDTAPSAPPFAGRILVPFPVESALSGVMTNFNENSKLWYHRSFVVPAAWHDRRVRLHFGAVDWRCEVWVNGHGIGQHQGGYDAFTFDITDALRWQGVEEVTVCVTDPTEGDQPRGKQSRKPEGIFYTSTSGIWQTVWLEPVPATCIDSVKTVPDVDAKTLHLRVAANNLSAGLQVEAIASANGREVARVTGPAGTDLVMNLPDARLWSPDDPFLYDLKVTLREGDRALDSVASYFGMRKISLRRDDNDFMEIALNNQIDFEVGTLDQGFWPDGIYTAPTDEALRSDIEFLKKAGFNLVRKHVKVEPDRWYYWCDKLGLLVWQDMPSANNSTPAGRRDFEEELARMVDSLDNHPSIIVWILFNEGWGQYDTEDLAGWLLKVDPSRLVDDASGWTDMHAGDLIDMHNYPGPNIPPAEPHRATVLGETGGMGLVVPNHVWSVERAWGYVMLTNASDLASRYTDDMQQIWRLHNLRGLSAAIYTQTADVESECNGLMTYDRAVMKLDPAVLAAANGGGAFHPPKKVILADALFGRSVWNYTTDKPATNWFQPGFDASAWGQGLAGFGTVGTPGIFLNANWSTADIWMRRQFTLTAEDIPDIKLQVFHDEDVEVYLNGTLALQEAGFITDYLEYNISAAVRSLLRPGENSIAVHCHQTTGGQGIDVGIIIPQPDSAPKSPQSIN
jgi:hypothetical protein